MSRWIRCRCALLLWLTACGGDRMEGAVAHEQADDAGVDQADAADFEGCPDSIPPFALGMSARSRDGSIKAVLRAASSLPPARFLNDWTVEFTDAQGNPLPNVSLRQARAFMPVHGHYGTPDPRLTQHEDEPALFDLDALNLFMRGPWQVQLSLSAPSTGETALVFEVCVEE